MRSGLVTANGIRQFPLLLAILAPMAFLTGCDGAANTPYPTSMRYPLRDDLIVVTPPKNSKLFPFAEPPGHLEEVVAAANGLEGGKTISPREMKAAEREELRKYLDATFGSPAEPKVAPGDDDDAKEIAKDLLLDSEHLVAGSKLYRRHCLQCHGVAGDGRGPTGPWVNPHPRDYRQGLFKFVSSVGGGERKPRREDLHRTLTVGIDGTSMPSFSILQEDEIQDLISYVIHLSIRGDVEIYVDKQVLNGSLDGSVSEAAASGTNSILKYWKTSQQPLQPSANTVVFSTKTEEHEKWAKSVENGYDWFTNSKVGNCVSCHIDFGRQAQFRYDAWGTLIRPNNLTAGTYRGGRRPLDLFWRIRGGINPCEMPKNEDEAKVWDLVNFVQALPYPEMLPESVRNKVYPERNAEKKLAER